MIGKIELKANGVVAELNDSGNWVCQENRVIERFLNSRFNPNKNDWTYSSLPGWGVSEVERAAEFYKVLPVFPPRSTYPESPTDGTIAF